MADKGTYNLKSLCQENKWTVSPKLAEVTPRYKRKLKLEERPQIGSPLDAETILRKVWDRDMEFCEIFVVLLLDGSHRLLGWMKLAEGARMNAQVDPAKLFTLALITNSTSIILAHSHPSGSLEPSRADRDTTDRLVKAGGLLDIKILDHLILTSSGCLSFRERGYL
jgi:DNA repair protein RadC